LNQRLVVHVDVQRHDHKHGLNLRVGLKSFLKAA